MYISNAIQRITINFNSDVLLVRFFPLGEFVISRMFCPGHPPGDPQFLHVPSDTIHPSASWSASWSFTWHYHMNKCSQFFVFYHSLHISIYQRSLISLTFSCMLFTPSSFLMSTLFTLSLSVTPLILLNILISIFSRICSSFFLSVQYFAPYRSIQKYWSNDSHVDLDL